MLLKKRGGLHGGSFFFQAEDGIRDADVTGVQTCALPISSSLPPRTGRGSAVGARRRDGPFLATPPAWTGRIGVWSRGGRHGGGRRHAVRPRVRPPGAGVARGHCVPPAGAPGPRVSVGASDLPSGSGRTRRGA